MPSDQIDPMLFEKSYYLEPEKTGAKPYALLRQALLDADRMAVVTVALRQRTTVGVLRVKDDVIVLQTMMWPDEVRTPDFNVEAGEVKPAEVKMANMLVETLAGDFDAERVRGRLRRGRRGHGQDQDRGRRGQEDPDLDQVLRRGRRPAGRAAALGRRGQEGPRRDRLGDLDDSTTRRGEAGQEDRREEDRQEGRRAKKATTKKTAAKKTTTKKATAKKTTAKKTTPPKKTTTRKVAARKAS